MIDGEPGALDSRSGVAPDMATASEKRPDAGRIQDALDASESWGLRLHMFEEPQFAAGLQHSFGFAQCASLVGD